MGGARGLLASCVMPLGDQKHIYVMSLRSSRCLLLVWVACRSVYGMNCYL